MIWKLIFVVIASGLIAAGIARARVRARRRSATQLPELNQHPERLEQMLDPTDDA